MVLHLPVNHRLRGMYRTLATLAGLFVLIFGIIGFVQTRGMDTFDLHGERVLGLSTNPGFAILSVIVGAVVVVATLVGRNIDVMVNFVAGSIFWLAGLSMLALLRTDLNLLAFSVTNCVVSFVIGLFIFTEALYGRIDRSGSAGERSRDDDREPAAH